MSAIIGIIMAVVHTLSVNSVAVVPKFFLTVLNERQDENKEKITIIVPAIKDENVVYN